MAASRGDKPEGLSECQNERRALDRAKPPHPAFSHLLPPRGEGPDPSQRARPRRSPCLIERHNRTPSLSGLPRIPKANGPASAGWWNRSIPARRPHRTPRPPRKCPAAELFHRPGLPPSGYPAFPAPQKAPESCRASLDLPLPNALRILPQTCDRQHRPTRTPGGQRHVPSDHPNVSSQLSSISPPGRRPHRTPSWLSSRPDHPGRPNGFANINCRHSRPAGGPDSRATWRGSSPCRRCR
jgi:hypothetical protein